jgi:hypothetical protein
VASGLAAALGGCGAGNGAGVEPSFPALCNFSYWDSLSASTCRGWLGNFGHNAKNATVELWYATALGETSRVVYVGEVGNWPTSTGFSPFFAPPQVTNGEPRFPRVGQVLWTGGVSPAQPRSPELHLSQYLGCWSAPDSLSIGIGNRGGFAYHVVVTLENRDGVRDFSPPRGHLAPGSDGWNFKSVARESSGILVPPIVRGLRWEDYGGIQRNVVPPPTPLFPPLRCY